MNNEERLDAISKSMNINWADPTDPHDPQQWIDFWNEHGLDSVWTILNDPLLTQPVMRYIGLASRIEARIASTYKTDDLGEVE